MVQSSILTFSFWQEGYFELNIRKGLMIHYGSQVNKDYKNVYSLRAGKCCGVHRRSDLDKPNAFEVQLIVASLSIVDFTHARAHTHTHTHTNWSQ
jgi:hypothetical protein